MRERMADGDEMRVDTLEQALSIVFGDAEQPDAIAQRRRLGDVGGEQVADAARSDIGKGRPGAEGEAGEDRQLVRGVDAVDVEAGIGLSEAQRLRLGEHFGKIASLRFHLGEDEIAGAVENAIDARDLVRGSPFAQPLDDGDAAGDRRLEFERDLGGFGRAGKFQSVMREHRLVGGDEALAAAECRPGERERRAIRAADQFDHHVRLRVMREGGRVIDPFEAADINAAVLGAVARGNRDDLDRAASAPGNQRAIGIDQPDHAAADSTEAGQCDA